MALSNVHKQAILVLCGAAALARLEQCKKMDISSWITTGANIQPILMPVKSIAYLHDWTDITPEGPAGSPRAAYIEDRTGQYFLRVASRGIAGGEVISDANTDHRLWPVRAKCGTIFPGRSFGETSHNKLNNVVED